MSENESTTAPKWPGTPEVRALNHILADMDLLFTVKLDDDDETFWSIEFAIDGDQAADVILSLHSNLLALYYFQPAPAPTLEQARALLQINTETLLGRVGHDKTNVIVRVDIPFDQLTAPSLSLALGTMLEIIDEVHKILPSLPEPPESSAQ